MKLLVWEKENLFNPAYWSSAIAFSSFILALISGFFLGLWYEPSPAKAYESIAYIRDYVSLGHFLLSLHHYSTHALLLATLVHLVRVFIMGTYRGYRYLWVRGSYLLDKLYPTQSSLEVSLSRAWYSGVVLLPLAVLFLFTGYLLRWDEVGYWSVEITSSVVAYTPLIGSTLKGAILGSSEITSRSLARFYNYHFFLLPLLYIAFLLLHYYYIKKGRLYWVEVGVAGITAGFLILISLALPFELSSRVGLELTSELKPPWLFLWLYVIERGVGFISPMLNFLNPLVLLAILLAITLVPVLDRSQSREEKKEKRWRIVWLALGIFLGMSILGYLW